MEEWRDIPSLPGYQASSHGRIRSVQRVVIDKIGRRQAWPEKLRRLHAARNGYLQFNALGHQNKVHSVVLEAFVGPRPRGCQGAHNDGCQSNNAIANLRWATTEENAADKHRHGTTYRPKGEAHPQAKLSDALVAELKGRHGLGEAQADLARAYSLDRRTVNSIVRGKSWTHVAPQQSDMRAMGKVG